MRIDEFGGIFELFIECDFCPLRGYIKTYCPSGQRVKVSILKATNRQS
jgi:hypothetical protein